MKCSISPTFTTMLLAVSSLSAATHYVSLDSTNPTRPYTNLLTATTNIQDAIDVATAGDEIVVTNGVYGTGRGRVFGDVLSRAGGETNRVTVDKPLTLRSANGPETTIIDGLGGMRCVYLTNGAVLAGFTLTNGRASHGGGVCCESTNAFLSNCVIVGNLAGYGGGGAFGGTLNNCAFSANYASYYGGGYRFVPTQGGGAWWSTLYNCTLKGNCAIGGGGAYACTLYNSTVTGNSAGGGGGADSSTLYNCTLTGNSSYRGGGAYSSTLNNSIVYFNTATLDGADYDTNSTLNYCCTAPLPTNGVGNITNAPLFVNYAAGNLHLDSHSPCVNAGSNDYVSTATDLDGRPRVVGGTVDMGAYEYRALLVSADSPTPTPPYATWATAATNIQDAVDAAVTGDEIVVTNGLYSVGEREAFRSEGHSMGFNRVAITNAVTLRSVNGPQFTMIDGGGEMRCVALSDGASLSGFTLTNGRARVAGGGVWCASTNAFLTNCVIVGNTAPGSKVSMWDFGWGGGVAGCTLYNCALTGNSSGFGGGTVESVLYNCTLTDNRGGWRGGGAAQCTLYNCTLSDNSAPYGAISLQGYGGGAWESSLYNCVLTANSAEESGGGADSCTLYNCTLTGNVAADGGGANGCWLYNCTVVDNVALAGAGGVEGWCTLYNCIVAYNSGWSEDNFTPDSTLNYCCTEPLPTNGVGNISVAPWFVNYAHGDLRLKPSSPCINAGNNASLISRAPMWFADWFTNQCDFDGNPRVVSGTVDIGAYEYQGTGSRISYAWLQQYDLPTTGSADALDPDGDGMINWQEWVCGTCPTNALSTLRLLSARPTPSNAVVSWQSVAGVDYFLERSPNLASPFTLLATNILGQAGTTSYADTNAIGPGPFFYRVGVEYP